MFSFVGRLQEATARRLLDPQKYRPRSDTNPGVTIVTGASEGIGIALSKAFAGCHHDLMLIARDADKLNAAADALRANSNVDVQTVAADLTTPEGCQAVTNALEEKNLVCDFLVNIAGVGLSGPFTSHSPEDLNELVDLNMRGLTDLTSRVLPGMVARGYGGILNIASLGGMVPGPYQAAYYASKAYVISLSEALAHEVRGTGVRITVAAPGPVGTKFHHKMKAEHDFYIKFLGAMPAEAMARSALFGFAIGQKVVVPGFINFVFSIFVRFVPHFIMVPVIGWLLRRRGPNDESGTSPD